MTLKSAFSLIRTAHAVPLLFACVFTVCAFDQTGAFEWTVPAQIRTGQPFPVLLKVRPEHPLAPASNAAIHLSAIRDTPSGSLVISELDTMTRRVEFTNVGRDPVNLDGWRAYLYDSIGNNVPRGFFQFLPGSVAPAVGVFQLHVGTFVPGSYPIFRTNINTRWESGAAVVLVDQTGKPVDMVQVGSIVSCDLPGQGAVNLWKGAVLPHRPVYARIGGMNHFSAVDWTNFPSSLGNLNTNMIVPFAPHETSWPLTPGTVTLSNGEWFGELTLNEEIAAGVVNVRADDLRGKASQSGPVTVLPRFALSVVVPASHGEGDSGALRGTVSIPAALSGSISVQLTSSEPEEISVPAMVIIPIGLREADFDLVSRGDDVLDGTRVVTITARASGLAEGSATIEHRDGQTSVLSLEVPGEMAEGATNVATLRSSRALGRDVQVNVIAEIPGRLALQQPVTLNAGQTNVSFEIGAVDDSKRNGDVAVQLQAEVANWTSGAASVLVRDNEETKLSIVPGGLLREGGFATNFSLTLGGSVETNVLVGITVEPAGVLILPAGPLVIPAGSNSIVFALGVADNLLRDGARPAILTARAAGFPETNLAITILDDEVHKLVFEPLSPQMLAGSDLSVRVSAVDDGNRLLTNRHETLAINASGGAVLLVTSNGPARLTNGIWSGTVTITGETGLIELRAEGAGVNGLSQPFVLRGESMRMVSLEALTSGEAPEMLFDQGTSRLYLLSTNGLATVDPITGAFELVATAPGGRHLVRTDGGEYLYWTTAEGTDPRVTRFDLQTRQWTNFPLAAPVAALQVVPSAPRRFVAATPLFTPPGLWNYGAFMFEDGNPLPEGAGFGPWGQSYTALFFDGPDILYGYEGHVTSFRFARHTVTSNGITFVDVPSGAEGVGAYDLPIHNGMVYGLTGAFNPAKSVWTARFPFEGRPWLHPETGQLVLIEPLAVPRLRAFDLQTIAPTGSESLPRGVDPRADLAFCGSTGVAMLGTNSLWILEPTFLRTNATAELSVRIEDSPEPARSNEVTTIRIVATNSGAVAAENVLLQYTAPSNVHFVGRSGEPPLTNRSVFGRTFLFSYARIPANGSVTAECMIAPFEGTSLEHRADVATTSLERNYANNHATGRTAIATTNLSVTEWEMKAGDIVWDSKRNRLYATVNDPEHNANGWLIGLDLVSQTVSNLVYIGTQPGRMALTDDQKLLYVSTEGGFRVRRLDLESGNIDSEIEILSYWGAVHDLAAFPNHPRSVGVLFAQNGAGAIFDDSILRTNVSLGGNLIRAGDAADVLIGNQNSIPGYAFRLFAPPEREPEILYGDILPDLEHDFTIQDGLLFSGSGLVLDAGVLRFYGAFPGITDKYPDDSWMQRPNQRVAADVRDGRVYYVEQTMETWRGSWVPTLHTFSLNELTELGTNAIPQLAGVPKRFVHCGEAGLAFLKADGRILTTSRPFTNSLPEADISVTQLTPVESDGLRSPITFQIAVTNHGPGVARNLVLRDNIPVETEFLDATTTAGIWIFQNGVVRVDLGDMPPGTGQSMTFRVSPQVGRKIVNAAFVAASNPDPILANNRAQASPLGYLSQVLPVQATDLTYDKTRDRILATVGSNGARWSNSIVSIDPETGETELVVRTQFDTTVIAVTDDGRYAYAGVANTNIVWRVNLESKGIDRQIRLEAASGPMSPALAITTIPNVSESVIVSSSDGAVVFDGATARPESVGPSHQLTRSESDDIFYQSAATFFQTGFNTFRRLQLVSGGLRVILETNLTPGIDFQAEGALLAFGDGQVVDGRTGTVLGQADVSGIVSGQQPVLGPGLADVKNGAVMFVSSPSQPFFFPGALLRGFSTNGYREQWSALIPDVTQFPGRFIHAGPKRAAMIAYCTRPGLSCPGSQVVLVNLDAIRKQPRSDLSVVAESKTNLVVGSRFTAKYTVANYGPWSLNGAEFTLQVPQGLRLENATSTVGQAVVTNGTVRVLLGDLQNNGGGYIDLTFTPLTEGEHIANALVRHDGLDVVPENNTKMLIVHAAPLPAISIEDAVVAEGRQNGTARLTLSHAIPETVVVPFTARSGSATVGEDILLSQTNGIVAAGATTGMVQFIVRDDLLIESTEAFTLQLLSATKAVLGRSEAAITIQDNDTYRVSVSGGGLVSEGNSGFTNADFRVTLSQAAPETVYVTYLAGGGTAGTDDYVPARGTLAFAPGVTNLTVSVPVIGDVRLEPEELFGLTLQNPVGGELQNSSSIARIADDDENMASTIRQISVSGSRIAVEFDTLSGRNYQVQWRARLSDGDWSAVGNPLTATGSTTTVVHVIDAQNPTPSGFYRVALW